MGQAAVQLTLYTRLECHLCEDMVRELRPMSDLYNFNVNMVVINGDEELERIYGERVPVLVRESKIICEYFLDKNALVEELKNDAIK